MSKELIKVCGTTSEADIMAAVHGHADSIGLICEPPDQEPSGYTNSIEHTQELSRIAKHFQLKSVLLPHTTNLLAILEMNEAIQPDRIQFGQSEDPALPAILRRMYPQLEIAQVIHVDDDTEPEAIELFWRDVDIIHLDTAGKSAGGTGETHDWQRSREIAARAISRGVRVMLSGGLTPHNVLEAVESVDPDSVDVQTSIKVNGKNDPASVRLFANNARFALQRMRRRRLHDRQARDFGYAAI